MPANQNWFFVYIIESPSEIDIYHNRTEGIMLQQALSLQNIPCINKLAISKSAFEASFQVGLIEAMQIFPNLIPIIHISAHGYSEGIGLSNHEIVSWEYLRSLLLPINASFSNKLILCMSTCEGYSACRMAMQLNGTQHPFLCMIGHPGSPEWSDTAVAFSTFYHLIAKGVHLLNAVEAMKIASGDDGFLFTTAEQSQRSYIEYCKQADAQEMQQQLQQQLPEDALTPLSKRTRE